MSSYFVVPLSPSYVPQVDALMSEIFGSFDKRIEFLTNWSRDSRLNCLVLKIEDKIIGGATTYVDIKPDFKKFEGFNLDMARMFDYEKPIGQILDLYIHPDYRRLGLAKMLIARQMNFFKVKNCKQFIGVSSVHGGSGNSQHFFNAHNFVALKTVPMTVANPSVGEYICARCGKACECEAILYAKSKNLELQSSICL